MNSKEFTIKLSHIEIAAKQWGNPDGINLLGLHGWLDNLATFEKLAPLLWRFNFIAIDLPGHGLSQHRPAGSVYHYIDYITEIVEVTDVLGWENFSLLGHSMGGSIAGLVASVVPHRVERLILLDFIGTYPTHEDLIVQQLTKHVKEIRSKRFPKMPLYDNIERMIESRAKVGNIFVDIAKIIVERGVKQVGDKYTWRSDPRLTISSAILFTETYLAPFLEAIKSPTLLFLSESTFAHYQEFFARRIELIANLEIVYLKSNHYLHFDKAEIVAKKINSFFP